MVSTRRRSQTKKVVEEEAVVDEVVEDEQVEVEEKEEEIFHNDAKTSNPPRRFPYLALLFVLVSMSSVTLWFLSPTTVLRIQSSLLQRQQPTIPLKKNVTKEMILAAKEAEAEAIKQEAIRIAEVMKQKEVTTEQQKFKEQENQLATTRARRMELEKEEAIEISMTKKKEEAVARAKTRRLEIEQEERTLTEEAAIAMQTKEKVLQLKLKNEAELARLEKLEKQKAQELILMKRQEEQVTRPTDHIFEHTLQYPLVPIF